MKLSQLNEGIRRDASAVFELDLDNDQVDDLVYLTGMPRIREKHTKWYNVKIYHSFMINTNVVTRAVARDLAHHLKEDPIDSARFIDLAAEHFVENYAKIADIDLITYPQSGSGFNNALAKKIAEWTGARVIDAGFIKKTLGQTGVTQQSRQDMHQFRKAQISQKKHVLAAIWDYLFQDGLDKAGKYIGQYWRIVDPERTKHSEKGRYEMSQRKYYAPLIKRLRAIEKLYHEVAADPEKQRLDELVDLTAEYWAEREAFKLEKTMRNQIGKNTLGQSSRPTQIKKIIGKDKREFLDFLDISSEMSSELNQYSNILVVDDNTDYGGTFSRINQLIGGIEGLSIHYYAPLLMTVDESALRRR
jgi:hypothetical protein